MGRENHPVRLTVVVILAVVRHSHPREMTYFKTVYGDRDHFPRGLSHKRPIGLYR